MNIDEMNTLTPEEMNLPVTYGDLMMILPKMIEEIANGQLKINDMQFNCMSKTIDKLIDNISEIDYKRQIDLAFIIGYLSSIGYWSVEDLQHMYNKYAEASMKAYKAKENKHDCKTDC